MPQRKRGRKYQEAKSKIETEKLYPTDEALKLVKEVSISSFDGSVDAHIKLVQKKKGKEGESRVRGSFSFPHTLQKESRVIVFCEAPQVEEAKKAGAVEAGLDELIKKIEGGWMDFDVAIAVPLAMPKIAKLGKVLGPKGMMPNPKTGTVTQEFKEAIAEYRAGKIEFKADESGLIHVAFGKVSFSEKELRENLDMLIKGVLVATGKTLESSIKSLALSPTMGPSVKVDVKTLG